MKYLVVLTLLFISLNADMMLKNSLGCLTLMDLKKAPLDEGNNSLELSMYAIAKDCMIISKRDKVEAIGYDSLNSKEIYQKILYKKTDVYLYIRSSSISVEQAGKKGVVRF